MRRIFLIVTTWEWLLLLLILPAALFDPRVGTALLSILPLFWLIRRVATGHFIPPTPYNVILLAMVVSILISFLAIFDFELSLPKITGLVMGIAIYYAAVEHGRQRANGVWIILTTVILVGTAIGIFSILLTDWSGPFALLEDVKSVIPLPIPSLPGGAVNPNELAGVLAWIVPLLAGVLFGYRHQLWQSGGAGSALTLIFLALCLVVTSFVLVATRSRGGIASVIIALLIMLAIEFTWGRVLLSITLLGGVIAVIAAGPEPILSLVLAGDNFAGLETRMEIWSRGLYGFMDFPLTGMSMNGFRELVHVLYPFFSIPPGTDIGHAHNHILQAGLDLGIFGLIAYLAIWLLSAGLLWKNMRLEDPNASIRLRPLLIGLSGSLAAGWFFGILDAVALGAKPGFIWWLLIALLTIVTAMIGAEALE